jgi:hypothetical protein
MTGLLAGLLVAQSSSVRVELHFESLCKQCQVHIAALNDVVFNAASEADPTLAGIQGAANVSVDYYGSIGPDGTCESAAAGTEHGPDMCVTDRYHLCAQNATGGSNAGAAGSWFGFVHCMFMTSDLLKCGKNGMWH